MANKLLQRKKDGVHVYQALLCGHPTPNKKKKLCPDCYKAGRRVSNYTSWQGGMKSPGYSGLEYRRVAEQVLGRPLKSNEVVHHVNFDKSDNRKSNLLICDRAYNMWLNTQYAIRYAQEKFS